MNNNNTQRIIIALVVIALGIAVVLGIALQRDGKGEVINGAVQKTAVTQTQTAQQHSIEERGETEDNQAKKAPGVAVPVSAYIEEVPFTSQAPLAKWEESVFQDGCEEASLLMAWHWKNGTTMTPQEAEATLRDMAAVQTNVFGHHVDTSAADTAKVAEVYFGDMHLEVVSDATIETIERHIANGQLVIIPTIGTELHNPNFSPPGPARHMLVIRGYNAEKQQFTVHDPGTRNGRDYVYDYNVIQRAWTDYPTGNHVQIQNIAQTLIAVSKNS